MVDTMVKLYGLTAGKESRLPDFRFHRRVDIVCDAKYNGRRKMICRNKINGKGVFKNGTEQEKRRCRKSYPDYPDRAELLQDHEVVVLNIFASWCGPCEKEFPEMEAVYEKYKDKMEIVAVSGDLTLDSMDDMIKYKEEHGLTFPVGMKNESIDSLTVGGFPTTYIVDRNGNIAYARTGAFQSGEEFEKVVTSLMGDDYKGKQIASYTFLVRDKDNNLFPDIQIHLFSDTVDEILTTGEDGMAAYFTEDAQNLNVEILNLPEGYTSNAGEITVGLDSGLKMITIVKK